MKFINLLLIAIIVLVASGCQETKSEDESFNPEHGIIGRIVDVDISNKFVSIVNKNQVFDKWTWNILDFKIQKRTKILDSDHKAISLPDLKIGQQIEVFVKQDIYLLTDELENTVKISVKQDDIVSNFPITQSKAIEIALKSVNLPKNERLLKNITLDGRSWNLNFANPTQKGMTIQVDAITGEEIKK